jgi:hypothetical protein
MAVTVYLRANQNNALTWNQVDSNFSTLAAQVNANTTAIANIGAATGGPTSGRPASPTLWQVYLDTDLGSVAGHAVPIWCTQITPSIIWCNSSGVSV